MEETHSKLNSTQKIVVNLLQQLVTECTDQVPATQPLYNLPDPDPPPPPPPPPTLVTESSDPVHSTLC